MKLNPIVYAMVKGILLKNGFEQLSGVEDTYVQELDNGDTIIAFVFDDEIDFIRQIGDGTSPLKEYISIENFVKDPFPTELELFRERHDKIGINN